MGIKYLNLANEGAGYMRVLFRLGYYFSPENARDAEVVDGGEKRRSAAVQERVDAFECGIKR